MASPYLPNDVDETRRRLLEAVGAKCVDDLFSDIPGEVRLNRALALPKARSEVAVRREIERVLDKNVTSKDVISFLGGGVWQHAVPAAVDSVASRSEFSTGYTPYQPEINQGMLQALFEYQSMLCELLDMEVADCSMYDWASSLGEATRMVSRINGREEFLVPHFAHPERLAVLRSYAEPAGIRVREVAQSVDDGQVDIEDLKGKVSSKTAGLYVENPAYLGYLLHSLEELSEIVHDVGGLFVVGVDPTSLGILKPPGTYGADIVVGEGQPLGNYVNYGGPLLGIFACRGEMKLIRQVPGRLVGMTTTKGGGERGYCLVLQTREQHIRRERATSNICTNEALCAVRAAAYMALMGREGFHRLGEYVISMSHYAMKLLSEIEALRVPLFEAPHFKEFTVNFDKAGKSVAEINRGLLGQGIIGGKSLVREFPELGSASLYCVTELHTRSDVETLVMRLRRVLEA